MARRFGIILTIVGNPNPKRRETKQGKKERIMDNYSFKTYVNKLMATFAKTKENVMSNEVFAEARNMLEEMKQIFLVAPELLSKEQLQKLGDISGDFLEAAMHWDDHGYANTFSLYQEGFLARAAAKDGGVETHN